MVMQVNNIGLDKGRTTILHDISFSLSAGEVTMLVGPNGVGKSTLLTVLAGLTRVNSGDIRVNDESTRHWSREQWASRISLVPQLSQMSFPLSVREVVELGGLAHSTSVVALREQTAQALKDWEIDYLQQQEVRLLSGGEQQRTQLARSWIQVQHPSSCVWLLDEPLSALDLRHQRQCLEHVQRLKQQGKTLMMVVHDLNLALRYADRVLMLSCGRLVADGHPAEVLTAASVSDVFQVETRLQHGVLSWM